MRAFKPLERQCRPHVRGHLLRTARGLAPAVACLLALRSAPAQQVAEPVERGAAAAAVKDAIRSRTDAAAAALSAKDHAGAVRHFANALWWDPFAAPVLAELVAASAPDEDAQSLWAHQLAAATADDRGALDAGGPLKGPLGRDPFIAKIATARAEAVAQLAASLKEVRGKDGDQAMLARWAFGVAQELAGPSPALRKRHAAAFNQALAIALPDYKPVLTALKEVMDKALGEQRPELAIRAAQCLLGFASQSRFKDLEGPKPPQLESVAMAARAGLARAREQLEARRKGAIVTIAELEAMSKEDREKFTREHASPENPGITLSPNARYRVETTCGHATLLGVARTVELHHERLARHFAQDPFIGQPGIVRIVPESSGLEAEGTPFWWAGGFQSGHITTVKFSCGTIGGLGGGLTHELTHRFDGALNAGIPAWLAEGRAVWTGAAFGPPADTAFVPNHASFWTVEDAYLKGYGDEANLKKLVEGTIEDYRHNYTAGYALYLYLASWKEKGTPMFAERLARFERGCKENGGNSSNWFAACFCDGKAGRPKDFKGFAEKFGEFVRGFYWQARAPFTEAYTEKVPERGDDPFVYDAPTWHTSRDRAEPWFGQDQARIGGEILLEAGRKREAAAAFEWSLVADEWRPEIAEKLAGLLEHENRLVGAWAVRSEAARRFERAPPPPAPPFDLARVAAKIGALADVMRAAQKSYAAGKPLCAAAMAADHDRIAARIGAKPAPAATLPPSDAARLHPLDEPPRALGLFGWEEDKLTHYEERRVKDLWYEVPEGDLHVGRSKPREGTGTMDRSAHQQHAAVRTREWFPAGRYVISARIQCTTSFTSGAIVFGWTRRDRGVRLSFNGGDFLYSIGAKADKTEFDSIGADLNGLRERDRGLWGAHPGDRVKFNPPTNTFGVRILVDGAQARAYVNDVLIGTYHTADGQAIEGWVGFAAGQGAYLVSAPTVHRRDRSRAAGSDPAWPSGLDLAAGGKETAREILNAAARGIPVGPAGAIVLWFPELRADGGAALAVDYAFLVNNLASALESTLKEGEHPSSFLVCLPAGLDADARKSLDADLKTHVPRCSAVLTHRHAVPLAWHQAEGAPPVPVPALLYLDPGGVVRVVDRFEPGRTSLSYLMNQWLRVFEALAAKSAAGGRTTP